MRIFYIEIYTKGEYEELVITPHRVACIVGPLLRRGRAVGRASARLFQLMCMDDGASGCRPSCLSQSQNSSYSGNVAVASFFSMILVTATVSEVWQRGLVHWHVGSGDARARVRFAHTCSEVPAFRRVHKR